MGSKKKLSEEESEKVKAFVISNHALVTRRGSSKVINDQKRELWSQLAKNINDARKASGQEDKIEVDQLRGPVWDKIRREIKSKAEADNKKHEFQGDNKDNKDAVDHKTTQESTMEETMCVGPGVVAVFTETSMEETMCVASAIEMSSPCEFGRPMYRSTPNLDGTNEANVFIQGMWQNISLME